MNFTTELLIGLVTPNPTGELKDHINFFKKRIAEMNAIKSNYNQKVISVAGIEGGKIKVFIKSELELGVPGRAFTGFSRSLLTRKNGEKDYDDFFEKNVFHGKLLTFEKISDENMDVENVAEMSDEDLMHGVVSLVMKPKTQMSRQEKEAILQIKNVLQRLNKDGE